MSDIAADKLINRHAERDEFQDLLKLQGSARMLVIDDADGTGKTDLMRILQYICKWQVEPTVPVSLVDLEEAEQAKDSFTLVSKIRGDLAESVQFPLFDQAQGALGQLALGNVTGVVDMRDATARGGIQAGVIVAPPPSMDAAQRQRCVTFFFQDLRSICEQQRIALLLDSYDKCQLGVRDWIRDTFIRLLRLDGNSPDKLIVVLAGTGLPDFKAMIGAEKYASIIRTRTSLTWEPEHVLDFLLVNGFGMLTDADREVVCRKVAEGCSISQALLIAEALKPRTK